MKKAIKRIIIALGVVLGLSVTFVGGVYASQYINWGGTNAYHNTLDTLEQIVTRGQTLKSERDTANQMNGQLVNQINDKENVIRDKDNVIRDKDNTINSKQQELVTKQQTINALNNRITELESQDKTEELKRKNKELEQAIEDMKDIDQKAKDALNKLN